MVKLYKIRSKDRFTLVQTKHSGAEDFATMVKVAAKNLYSYVDFVQFMQNPEILRRENRVIIEKIQLNLFEEPRGG